jgi:hypothetical protein
MVSASRALVAAAFGMAGALVGACALVAQVEEVSYGPTPTDSATSEDASVEATTVDATSERAPIDDGCDEDHDGSRATGACGGDDCDDTDPRTHPGADFVSEPPPAGRMGDWNCDGVVTKQYPERFTCFVDTAQCVTVAGFLGDAPCGQNADFITCQLAGGTTCAPEAPTKHAQGCR